MNVKALMDSLVLQTVVLQEIPILTIEIIISCVPQKILFRHLHHSRIMTNAHITDYILRMCPYRILNPLSLLPGQVSGLSPMNETIIASLSAAASAGATGTGI